MSNENEDNYFGKLTINKTIDDLIKEIIYQRLLQGFQIVLFESANNLRYNKNNLSLKFPKEENCSIFNKNDNFIFNIPCYLISGNHLHRISYDYVDKNIEVKRLSIYVKNLTE